MVSCMYNAFDGILYFSTKINYSICVDNLIKYFYWTWQIWSYLYVYINTKPKYDK